MKLSEAIRQGCKAGQQITGSMFDGYGDENSCAMGAALIATGRKDAFLRGGMGTVAMERLFPLLRLRCQCGPGFEKLEHDSLFLCIAYRNDSRGHTREQIADWVEDIENRQEPPAVKIKADLAREPVGA